MRVSFLDSTPPVLAGSELIQVTSTSAFQVATSAGSSVFNVDTSTPNVSITQLTDVSTRLFSFRPSVFGTIEAASNAPMRGYNYYLSAANAQSGKRANRAYSAGYNTTADNAGLEFADDFGVHMFRLETAYNGSGAERWMEGHLFQINTTTGSAATGNFYRPIALTAKWADFTGTGEPSTVQLDFQVTSLNFNSAGTSGSGTNRFNMTGAGLFTFAATSLVMNDTASVQAFKADCANKAFLVYSTAYISKQNNNQLWLYQLNSGGTNKSLAYLDSSDVWQFGAAATTINLSVATTAASTLAVSGSLVQGAATVGGAASVQRLMIQKTGIADNTATNIITITVPAGNHSATLDIVFNATDTGYSQMKCARGLVVVGRHTGANSSNATFVAIANAATITAAGGSTTLSAIAYNIAAGTVDATPGTETWNVTVTLDTGDGTTSICNASATLINSAASGITMAAA